MTAAAAAAETTDASSTDTFDTFDTFLVPSAGLETPVPEDQRACPICGRPSAPPGERSPRPFCTPRCQMVDLGRWLNEDYVVSDPLDPLAVPPERGDGDADGRDRKS